MSQKNNHIIYTAADIEKYHKGLLAGRERHAIEKAALDDPFLADALEGYAIPSVNSSKDIADLENRLAARIEQDNSKPLAPALRSSFNWWKIAAMFILVLGAALLVYQFGFNNKHGEIAETIKKTPANPETVEQNSTKADSVNLSGPADSLTGVVIQELVKDPGGKKSEQPSAGLVAPPGTAGNTSAESRVANDNFVTILRDTAIQATTEPAVKADDKENQTKKSAGKDIALNKPGTAEKNYDLKARKFPLPNKADADGVPDRFDGDLAKKPSVASNAIPKQQGFFRDSQTNIFRGRVTDANNNPLPFSNITNLEDKVGTYSDARGYFNLTSPDSVLNVQVRSLGFESNNVQLQNKLPENKILLEEDRSLSASVLDTVKRNTHRTRNTNMVLEEPEPVDGWSNYDTYLVNNLKIPESFHGKQSSGEVELSFEVNKNGEPVNITVKKSLCESCDKEAIRLIKEGPKWKRKIKKGKARVTVAF